MRTNEITMLRHASILALSLLCAACAGGGNALADPSFGWGTIPLCSASTCYTATPATIYDDGTDVGRAMEICSHHWHAPQFVYPENPSATPMDFDDGWSDCGAVRSKWDESARAKELRKQAEQERLDKAFVGRVAKPAKANK